MIASPEQERKLVSLWRRRDSVLPTVYGPLPLWGFKRVSKEFFIKFVRAWCNFEDFPSIPDEDVDNEIFLPSQVRMELETCRSLHRRRLSIPVQVRVELFKSLGACSQLISVKRTTSGLSSGRFGGLFAFDEEGTLKNIEETLKDVRQTLKDKGASEETPMFPCVPIKCAITLEDLEKSTDDKQDRMLDAISSLSDAFDKIETPSVEPTHPNSPREPRRNTFEMSAEWDEPFASVEESEVSESSAQNLEHGGEAMDKPRLELDKEKENIFAALAALQSKANELDRQAKKYCK